MSAKPRTQGIYCNFAAFKRFRCSCGCWYSASVITSQPGNGRSPNCRGAIVQVSVCTGFLHWHCLRRLSFQSCCKRLWCSVLLILLTTFLCRVWVLCAPAAFLGCDSRFSGSLSGIKPSVSVPRPCHDRPMPSRRKLIGRKLERRVVGQATLLALLQPAAEAGCVALELVHYRRFRVRGLGPSVR